MLLDGPNQLWVADITYIGIATGFVYLAAILDAWSRRVVGYAIGRSRLDPAKQAILRAATAGLAPEQAADFLAAVLTKTKETTR